MDFQAGICRFAAGSYDVQYQNGACGAAQQPGASGEVAPQQSQNLSRPLRCQLEVEADASLAEAAGAM